MDKNEMATRPDYKNWVPKGMAAGFLAGAGVLAAGAAMAERFPGAVIAFDACNERGLKMMLKTWVKEAGITDVGAFFSVRDAKAELAGWSDRFASVTSRGYMKGYRELGKAIPWLYRRMCSLCDGFISMQIVRIAFAD